MNASGQRKKLFVNTSIQGALMRQLIWHWFLGLMIMAGYLFIVESISTGLNAELRDRVSALWTRYAPLFIVVLTMFPVFLWDMLKLSHRFVGPIVSLKKQLQRMANGEQVPPLRFRDGDYWQELIADLNRVADHLGLSANAQKFSNRSS